jgi:hypothetical protein
MPSHSKRAPRGPIRLIALGLTAGAACLLPQAAFAWPTSDSSDGIIENFTAKTQDGGVLTIARAEFTNTNLSKDEIVLMLTPGTPEADERALAQKLKADKISIPTIDVAGKDGAKVHIHGVAAADVEAGKVGKLEFAGMEASQIDDGAPVAVKSGALRLEGLDVADALKAVGAPADAAQKGQLSHLTWDAIDIVAPDKDSGPGKTIHVALATVEVRGDYAGGALKQGSTKLTGLIVEPSPDSEFGKSLAQLGYSKLQLAMALGAAYRADAKTFSLDDLTIDGVDMGSVGLKANFGDIDPGLFGSDTEGRMAALFGCSISSLELKIVNAGLFEKALAFYAKQQGSSAEALKQQWSATIGQMAPLLLGGAPSALKAAAEAQKFVAAPKNLTVSIKARDGALKAADFMAISDPAAFASKLDIAAVANK